MNLLHAHIEQISQSSISIADLPFSSARPFTNALLRTTDITSLIRDTEAHERALFSTLPTTTTTSTAITGQRTRTRKSIYQPTNRLPQTSSSSSSSSAFINRILTGPGPGPGPGSGSLLLEHIQRGESSFSGGIGGSKEKADPDVASLLDGAEKLCEVYPIAGAKARIAALRTRHQTLAASVERYEGIVQGQVRELERLNNNRTSEEENMGGGDVDGGNGRFASRNDGDLVDGTAATAAGFTRDDLAREEAETKELEERRRLLEQRVNGMERDLGALGG